MNKSILKKFVEDYFSLNNVKFTVNEHNIYTAEFIGLLANKLGKKRSFAFSREVADDYGVEYLSLNNDLIKYILRDSTQKGQLMKAKLNVSMMIKDKLKLNKNVLIKSETNKKELAIGFLFKVSSNDLISETTPEFLQYVVVGYNDGFVFPEEIIEEFHNFEFEDAGFRFDTANVNKCHTVAYESLTSFLNSKYSEHEAANKQHFKQRIEDLKNRHEHFIKVCRIEEKKLKQKLEEWRDKIEHARTYNAKRKYNLAKKKTDKKFKELYNQNKQKIKENFIKTNHRIKKEESKYDFEVKVQLLSAIVFQYDIAHLKLLSSITNEECAITYNKLIKQIQNYVCPICGKNAQEILLSVEGHFCCPKCTSFYSAKKGYLCERDNVAKCFMSGKLVPKNKSFKCYSCERYAENSRLKRDALGKLVCGICSETTYNGEIINKKDAVYSKKYHAYFKPAEVKRCKYSKDYYPKKQLVMTSGSRKSIFKKFIKDCEITGLTFTPNEVNGKISKLAMELKEKSSEKIKYPKLKQAITKKQVEFNENKYWALVKVKRLLRSKYVLYDKVNNKIISL